MWLYHRFPLSFREVEGLMLARDVIVSYKTVRQWCAKFGPRIRRCRTQAGEKQHLDATYLKIDGNWQYLSRARDLDGNALDTLVRSRRNAKAAKRLLASS
ncbi:IS6 family transposase [Streptomyces sioyaensis]|uniref:DDE-type integrase/transposase/recombinase n=1 Tax=Streptomyces sioyaensis TaxID=67364 RepID=UPI001F1B7E13|nr:DDE-type integrase/transposase/recombinase [Streptomyces sioyaensis]MCF3176305.1 IS6 family transposase [Streptomyces sioyaensis]